MPFYYPAASRIEAWLWNPNRPITETPDWLLVPICLRPGCIDVDTRKLTLRGINWEMSALVGEYIIRRDNGVLESCPAASFESRFAPIPITPDEIEGSK